MTTVLAALDNSLAGNPVLVTARALARMLGARELARYTLSADHDGTARNVAEAAGVPLRAIRGPVVDRLVEAVKDEDVTAVVITARGDAVRAPAAGLDRVRGRFTSLLKPVVVVPPDAHVVPEFHRILVPLEGTTSTSLAPRSIVELGRSAGRRDRAPRARGGRDPGLHRPATARG